MARLGIDYGTTHTVAVSSDRGRYPVVPHVVETAIGPVSSEVYPSLIVQEEDSGRFLFGFDAERALYRPGGSRRLRVIRSLKRLLGRYTEGARIADADAPADGIDAKAALTAFATGLHGSIARAGLFRDDEPMEAVLTWPANANGAQRHLTRRCFREAGFRILSTLGEPTAAAIEFADRMARGHRAAARKLDLSLAVFDLGGGTFDTSLLRIQGAEFTVLDTAGVDRLGGDDFDEALARLLAERAGLRLDSLDPVPRALLRRQARLQKESIGSGAVRSLVFSPADIGLPGGLQTVPVEVFLAEVRLMLQPALDKLAELLDGRAAREAGVDAHTLGAIYLVGGSSRLPLVRDMVSERFPGVRVVMSDKPFTSTAMGAAIRSNESMRLHDILSRTFGVIRLAEGGTREYFAPIFPAGTALPRHGEPPIEQAFEYAPHHNIGRLRYLECVSLDARGWPTEGIRFWSDTLFPYDPAIPAGAALEPSYVMPRHDLGGTRVRESYTCDEDGVITARITRGHDGLTAVYEITRGIA